MSWTPPRVALAPMAGITDAPFRQTVAQFGADLLVSEMIASGEMFKDRPLGEIRFATTTGDIPTSVQLAGRDPQIMEDAARYLVDQGIEMIDINMGCPAKKVISGAAGAALMREQPLAQEIMRAVRRSGVTRMSVKMRLGWDETQCNAPSLARIAQEEGADMIVVHGRTRSQFYKGHANWHAVAETVSAVSIPVLVNGDIQTSDHARQALNRSGAAGVMIGRAALGVPWRLAQIRAELNGITHSFPPNPKEILDLSSAHYEAILSWYPHHVGYRVARKHLGWYMDYAGTAPQLRQRVLQENDPQNVQAIWAEAMSSLGESNEQTEVPHV